MIPGLFLFPGYNLTQPTGLCAPGYYCISGAISPNPLMLNDSQCPTGTVHPIIGHACHPGTYCPQGSSYPQGCDPGFYQDMEAMDTCKSCPPGFYCYANTSDYTVNICPAGHYCLLETEHPAQYPCPAGTFNNVTGANNSEECLPCTPGMYCQGQGNDLPTDFCDPGWYCINTSSSATVSC